MVLIINEASIIAFITLDVMFIITSFFDLRDRRVSNRVFLVLGVIGVIIGIFTGHIINNWQLHFFALVTSALPLFLYNRKVMGGADVKMFILVSIISPGIEFTEWEWVYFEAFIAGSLQILAMLILGIIWSQLRNKEETRIPALIPLLFIGYLMIQLFAFF